MENPPQSPERPSLPYGLSDEIDLVEYVAAIFRAKYWILLFAIACGVGVYGLTHLQPVIYEAYAHLNVVIPEDLGGVSPDNRRAPEVLTLVEHGFIVEQTRDNYRDIVIASLKSRKFTNQFLKEEQVLRHLFEENWNPAAQNWVDGFKPDMNLAYELFNSGVRFVNSNPETGLIAIRVRWKDPALAARWTNRYADRFNDFMRQKTIAEVKSKTAYLREQLKRIDILEMQKAIYRLLEAQTAIAMLANAREEYALEIIDPAVPPTKKYSPKRTRAAALAFIGSLMLGIAVSVGVVMVRKIRKSFAAYR